MPSPRRGRPPASRKPRGRPPTKLTATLAAKLIGHLKAGAYLSHAAPACGIDRRTVYGWLELGRADAAAGKGDTVHALFVSDVEKARATAMVEATKEVRLAARTDWRAAAWYLARTAPDLFGERIEVDSRAAAHLERLDDDAREDEADATLDGLDDGELELLAKLASREEAILARALARRRKSPDNGDA